MPMATSKISDDSRPVPLVAGLGNAHHTIRTSKPEAQQYFNQGMDYLFAFNHEEARRSFAMAAALDPQAAMPLWGVALAVGPNYNDIDINHVREQQAFVSISKAKQLAAGGPPMERDYIQALSARYARSANQNLLVLGRQYSNAMAALVAKHPDDLDAATLYAESLMDLHPWQLWTTTGDAAPGTRTIVETLESVLLRDPNHVGANHFLIHAVEASRDPSLALPSAQRIAVLAPAAGHLVHMPAHIYQRVGDFTDAARANEKAVAADQAYFRSQHLEGVANMYDGMYYTHNIHFLASSCSMEGNAVCTEQAAAQLLAHVESRVTQNKLLEWFLPTQPWMLVRFGEWKTILDAPAPPKSLFILTAMWHYARGVAYSATADQEHAAIERQSLAVAIKAMPADTQPDFNNPAGAALRLALITLDARIEEAKGERAQAIDSWREAVRLLDSFAYNEPADWYYPVRESLGGALLRDGQPELAEAVFRGDLKHNPGNGRSLFGLWQSLLAQHRPAEAALVEPQFRAAWSHATVTLTIADL